MISSDNALSPLANHVKLKMIQNKIKQKFSYMIRHINLFILDNFMDHDGFLRIRQHWIPREIILLSGINGRNLTYRTNFMDKLVRKQIYIYLESLI